MLEENSARPLYTGKRDTRQILAELCGRLCKRKGQTTAFNQNIKSQSQKLTEEESRVGQRHRPGMMESRYVATGR